MNNKEELKKLFGQIRKYYLSETFDSVDEFEKWLSKLTSKQIRNFNSLEIDPNEILFPKDLLINYNLLSCDDYNKRVEAMSKLKNGDGCWHLFKRLCSLNFLNSKNYYKDMEIIAKADTARYCLIVINEDAFINSKYHDEDLKMIAFAKDTGKDGEQRDYVVASALASIAKNSDSINSPYHQEDMKLIANCGSECLSSLGEYPGYGLNRLATNKVSLSDKYHLENMKILAKNLVSSDLLCMIMTNDKIVNGKNYRSEVQALMEAKSKLKARAIYYYIANPKRDRLGFDNNLVDELDDCGVDYSCVFLLNSIESIDNKDKINYLEYLKLLNEIDDKFVMFVESLLSNKDLYCSGHLEYDLNVLLSVTDVDIFMDLFRVMTDEISLFGPHHREDVALISMMTDEKVRKLLVSTAIDEHNVASINHRYDMEYIAKLDLKNLKEVILDKIDYYLNHQAGIKAYNHVEMLEKLYKGEFVEDSDVVLDYLDELEKKIDNGNYKHEMVLNSKSDEKVTNKIKRRIRRIFGK